MFNFYEKYEVWEKCAREEMIRKKKFKLDLSIEDYKMKPIFESHNFTLLEDFKIESRLAINKSNFTPSGRGEVEVVVTASPVNFNLNNEVYNHLVNIHR